MAACKACLHYECCKTLNKDFIKKPKDYENNERMSEICTTFKDRSKFIELPCKIGDKVYVLSADDKIRVTSIEIISMFESSIIYLFNDGGHCYKNDFGKTVFLTKEEAEKELGERKKNDS